MKKFLQRLGVFAVALTMLASVGAFTATAAQAYPSSGYYKIKLTGWDRCLDVRGVNPNDGALIQTYNCIAGQPNQVFYLNSNGGGGNIYQIKTWVGKCLDVQGYSTANGANIQQYSCIGWSQSNQVFGRQASLWLTWAICLDAANGNVGSDVIQGSCSSGYLNQWDLISV